MTFELREPDWTVALVVVPIFALLALLGVTGGEPFIAVWFGGSAVVVAVGGAWEMRYRPFRVILGDGGIALEARARVIAFRWTELVSVERQRGRSRRLVWRRRSGRPVSTSDGFVDLHRLRTEIERRAPHVVVVS
jgi:hypothetical protein